MSWMKIKLFMVLSEHAQKTEAYRSLRFSFKK